MQGKVGKEHLMEIGGVENEGLIRFDWDEEIGYPGAMLVTNYNHSSKFFLKSITLHIPYWGNIHFNCNSWIQPKNYVHHRIFFLNKVNILYASNIVNKKIRFKFWKKFYFSSFNLIEYFNRWISNIKIVSRDVLYLFFKTKYFYSLFGLLFTFVLIFFLSLLKMFETETFQFNLC